MTIISNDCLISFDTRRPVISLNPKTPLQVPHGPIERLKLHMDMLIGAHALSLGIILVTNNIREFTRIKGLKIADLTA